MDRFTTNHSNVTCDLGHRQMETDYRLPSPRVCKPKNGICYSDSCHYILNGKIKGSVRSVLPLNAFHQSYLNTGKWHDSANYLTDCLWSPYVTVWPIGQIPCIRKVNCWKKLENEVLHIIIMTWGRLQSFHTKCRKPAVNNSLKPRPLSKGEAN